MSDRVRDLGEFALIERLIAALPAAARGTDSVGGQQDDCAWWTSAGATTSIVSTDALVEGVHFRLDWTDWRSLGHKMLAVNLSDLASMGASPRVAVVTLALTGDEMVSDLEEMYRGAGDLAAIYGLAIIGGDIVRTPGPLTLSVTVIGERPAGSPLMTRAGAKPGDVVLVSGTLGASAAGLQLLAHGDRGAASAELLIAAHLRPAPRVSLGQALLDAGVRCCMDLSDGLAGDLPKILAASGVGASIALDSLPILPAVQALFPESFTRLAVAGGEDYELLFTAAPALVDGLIALAATVGATITPIGEISEAPGLTYTLHVRQIDDLPTGAWDHFGTAYREPS